MLPGTHQTLPESGLRVTHVLAPSQNWKVAQQTHVRTMEPVWKQSMATPVTVLKVGQETIVSLVSVSEHVLRPPVFHLRKGSCAETKQIDQTFLGKRLCFFIQPTVDHNVVFHGLLSLCCHAEIRECAQQTSCRNGGTCFEIGTRRTCVCAAGFTGSVCQNRTFS